MSMIYTTVQKNEEDEKIPPNLGQIEFLDCYYEFPNWKT